MLLTRVKNADDCYKVVYHSYINSRQPDLLTLFLSANITLFFGLSVIFLVLVVDNNLQFLKVIGLVFFCLGAWVQCKAKESILECHHAMGDAPTGPIQLTVAGKGSQRKARETFQVKKNI